MAEALARAGQHEQAATVARSITDPDRRAQALAAVAEALARAGQHEQAADRGPLHHRPGPRAQALAAVAEALARPASTSRPPRWPAPSPTRTGGRRR